MSLEIIPLQATYCPDRSDVVRFGAKPRGFVIEELVAMVLRDAKRHIKIQDERGPYGEPMTTARLDIADGMGNLRDLEQSILTRARMQADAELSVRHWALANAEKEFADRFRGAIEEFLGYDECAGRR